MERLIYTAAELQNWKNILITPPLRLAVFGDPVAHSASPPMHNAALEECGLPLRYTRLQVHAKELGEALRLLAPAGFLGVNLTIPHKTAALPLLDAIDPAAAKLGAVNTVRVESGGRLQGFNTDGPGFVRAVREEFGVELKSLRVLVLGAGGGAGRALSTQCALEGVPRILLANRTAAKAQALAGEIGECARVVNWDPVAFGAAAAEVDLVVNATALGLRDDGQSPLPSAAMREGLLVFDTVYRVGKTTPLLAAAREAGARTADGFALLLHQGALAFEIWFDRPAPLEAMRQALKGNPA